MWDGTRRYRSAMIFPHAVGSSGARGNPDRHPSPIVSRCRCCLQASACGQQFVDPTTEVLRMRPARRLVSLLVIFAFMKIAIANPSSAFAWPVTVTVEKIAHEHAEGKKEVVLSGEVVTPPGKIEISRAVSNAYIRVSAAGASGTVTARRTAFYLSF